MFEFEYLFFKAFDVLCELFDFPLHARFFDRELFVDSAEVCGVFGRVAEAIRMLF